MRAARPGRFARLTSEADGVFCRGGERLVGRQDVRPCPRPEVLQHTTSASAKNNYVDGLCGGRPRRYLRSEDGDLLQVEDQIAPSSLFEFLRRVHHGIGFASYILLKRKSVQI